MTLFYARTPTLPPIKWAGGKRWLVPILEERLPHYTRFVEPCMGALSVTLGIAPKEALVNDINPHLVNFYTWVQKGLNFELPYGYSEVDYYAARNRFNECILSDDIMTSEMAQLFYYMNRTGFNGLCRFNKSGLFNVPFGRYKTINYRRNFDDITEILEGYSITWGDFSYIEYRDGDFIYVDPPYDGGFTTYSASGFDWEKQQQLAQFYAQLGLPVVISNLATPRILELYQDLNFQIQTLMAPRRISSAGQRDPALEVLAWNDQVK